METKSKQKRVRVPKVSEPVIEPVIEPAEPFERLFVYGIFLSERNRTAYGMINPEYATVKGFITIGDYIVSATPTIIPNASLTGLLVEIPTRKLPAVDRLEYGYSRIMITTTDGQEAFMYATPGSAEDYSANQYSGVFYE